MTETLLFFFLNRPHDVQHEYSSEIFIGWSTYEMPLLMGNSIVLFISISLILLFWRGIYSYGKKVSESKNVWWVLEVFHWKSVEDVDQAAQIPYHRKYASHLWIMSSGRLRCTILRKWCKEWFSVTVWLSLINSWWTNLSLMKKSRQHFCLALKMGKPLLVLMVTERSTQMS